MHGALSLVSHNLSFVQCHVLSRVLRNYPLMYHIRMIHACKVPASSRQGDDATRWMQRNFLLFIPQCRLPGVGL